MAVIHTSGLTRRFGSLIAARVDAFIESPAFAPNLTARANLLSLAHLRGLDTTRVDEVLDVVGLLGRDRGDPAPAARARGRKPHGRRVFPPAHRDRGGV